MITSTRNPKIQWVRSLLSSSRKRREAGVFVIEGVRLLEEATAAGIIPRLILYTAELTTRGAALLDQFSPDSSEILETTPGALKAASDTITPQGILAVCPLPGEGIAEPADLVLVLDQLRDPGNLGTILRTAAALGVQQVLLSPASTDPYSPKALRAGMGAQFQIHLLQAGWDSIGALLETPIQGEPIQILLAEADSGTAFTKIDFRRPTAIIIGSEAEGAGLEALEIAQQSIYIPMPGGAESLNAAVAAGILLYEVAHQRL